MNCTIAFPDEIYPSKDDINKGITIEETEDVIICKVEGMHEKIAVKNDEDKKIENSSGNKNNLAKKENIGGTTEEKGKMGFSDSIVRIGGFFGFGKSNGGLFNSENRVLNAYRADLVTAYILPWKYKMYSMYYSGGAELDIMLPAVKFKQKRKFDFSGIKFGFRGRYGYEVVESIIANDVSFFGGNFTIEDFTARLMNYQYCSAGPVINFIFGPRDNLYNLLLNLYAMGGYIFEGTIGAAAALRDAPYLALRLSGAHYLQLADVTHSRYFNTTKFRGYNIRCGIGPHFSLNKYFPIMFGINIIYAYTNITMNRLLPIYYDGNRKSVHHEIGGEISLGVHL